MISNLKKLALGIMAAGGLVVPLAVVASCNSSDTIDLKIEAKTSVELKREDIWLGKYKELATLVKVFDGMNETRLEKIKVDLKTITEGSLYQIILTANEGYTIDGETSLKSTNFQIPVENLVIEDKEDVPAEVARDDVFGENLKTIATLSKFFDLPVGMSQAELDESVEVRIQKATTRQSKWVIILTPKPGFRIGGADILVSEPFDVEIVDLVIEKIDPAPTDITAEDIGGEKFKTFAFLSRLFTGSGFEASNLQYIDVTLTNVFASVYTIILAPTEGFTINGSSEAFVSANFSVGISDLTITKKAEVPKDITEDEVKVQDITRVRFLSKLFEGDDLTQEKINEGLIVSLNPISEGALYKVYTIVLTARTGFTIGGATTLSSNRFTLQADVNVNTISLSGFPIAPEDIAGENYKSWATLVKLFTFDTRITSENVEDIFSINKSEVGSSYLITLHANDGFILNGVGVVGGKEIDSDFITLPSNYTINKRTDVTEFKPSQILNGRFRDFAVLDKLFVGGNFHEDMLNTLTITLSNPTSEEKYTITLTPNTGYTINGSTEGLTSIPFTIPKENIQLVVIESTPKDITWEDIQSEEFVESREFLSQLFELDNTWTQEKILETFSITTDEIPGSVGMWRIILTPINSLDVTINGGTSLPSSAITLVVELDIDQLSLEPFDITAQDVDNDNFKSWATLQKLFNFNELTEEVVMNAVDVTMHPMEGNEPRRVTLTARPGYSII
ncbi:MAG: hypothetical protein ACRCXE_00245, partial [Metamycoplasmataceae bacterium]